MMLLGWDKDASSTEFQGSMYAFYSTAAKISVFPSKYLSTALTSRAVSKWPSQSATREKTINKPT